LRAVSEDFVRVGGRPGRPESTDFVLKNSIFRVALPSGLSVQLAADWVGKGGRARMLRDAEVTATRQKAGAVVCVKAVGMKEVWHLAASDGALSAPQIITLYSKRWTIEPNFRDSKDLRFGMGMSVLRIDNPQRRDRLLLLNAFAVLLLTILGTAGESLGMDRELRTSTAKRPVPCSGKDACSTTSSPTCQTNACDRSSNEAFAYGTSNGAFVLAVDRKTRPYRVMRRFAPKLSRQGSAQPRPAAASRD
jgi:hypothetical protein